MGRVQVRLDPDVAAAVGRSAREHERSVSAETNIWLRKALTEPKIEPRPGSASVSAARRWNPPDAYR